MKAAIGLILVFIVDSLQLWLSATVILSWVMKSKYFFPIPYIPIRPAALIATASGNTGGAGSLGNYGLNVGPMAISWIFRFVNGKLELFMGRAMLVANKRLKKQKKAAQKERERQATKVAKEERKKRRARKSSKFQEEHQQSDAAARKTPSPSDITRDNEESNFDCNEGLRKHKEEGTVKFTGIGGMDELD